MVIDMTKAIEEVNRIYGSHIFYVIYWDVDNPEEELGEQIMKGINIIKEKQIDTFFISDFFCGIHDYVGLIFSVEKFNSAQARNIAEDFLNLVLE